jgi:Na+-transporting methylmalonyl-CoA/oxaloacetate decarboxylase gamma subunit
VSEACEAIKLYDVRQSAVPHEDQVDRIESEFVQAQATGRLAQVVSQAVIANRRQAAKGG